MDHIVDDGHSKIMEHPFAKIRETTSSTRSYRFNSEDDIFEPIQHIPHSKFISAYKCIKQPLLEKINKAQIKYAPKSTKTIVSNSIIDSPPPKSENAKSKQN